MRFLLPITFLVLFFGRLCQALDFQQAAVVTILDAAYQSFQKNLQTLPAEGTVRRLAKVTGLKRGSVAAWMISVSGFPVKLKEI